MKKGILIKWISNIISQIKGKWSDIACQIRLVSTLKGTLLCAFFSEINPCVKYASACEGSITFYFIEITLDLLTKQSQCAIVKEIYKAGEHND